MRRKEEKIRSFSDWYMEGYEWVNQLDASGKTHRAQVYHGLYYQYDVPDLTRYKLTAAAGVLIYILLTCAVWFIPGEIIWYGWAGAVSLLLVIPMLFLVIGTGFFLGQKPPLTSRQTYSGFWRMIRSLNVQLWISILSIVCMIIAMAMNSDHVQLFPEVLAPVLLVVGIAYNRFLSMKLKKNMPEA